MVNDLDSYFNKPDIKEDMQNLVKNWKLINYEEES